VCYSISLRQNGTFRLANCRPSRAWWCTSLRSDASATERLAPSPSRRPRSRRLPIRTSSGQSNSVTSARTFRAPSCRSRSPAQPNMASTSRWPGWCMRRCYMRPISGVRRRRSTTPQPAKCPTSPTWCNCRTVLASSVPQSRRPWRHAALSKSSGRTRRLPPMTAKGHSRNSQPSPATRAVPACPSARKATPRPRWRVP
jgi:hypothetical protein